jgi:DNA-binding PadR family transcriptional regulator
MLVLWLLLESSLHGYRIKRILHDRAMRFWFPVQDASIYAVLRSLVKHGYARVLRTEREGRRPRRTRYSITPKGRQYLAELLRNAWVALESPADPFHLALAAKPEIGEDEVPALLERRRAALLTRLDELESQRRSAPAQAIVDRQRAITAAELDWINSLPELPRRAR